MSLREALKQTDFRHVWHPFTQAKVWFEENDPLIVERAEGVELIDVDGRRYLDGVSSLWCNVHGHANPELVSALSEQSKRLCHSTLLGLSHRPIIELTSELLRVVPAGLQRIFYADSGSTAVEAALRLCLEWWQKQGSAAGRKKTRLLSLEGAYHGDTLGAVGVGYSETFHSPLAANVVPALKIPPPHLARFYSGRSEADATTESLLLLKQLLDKAADEIAAMIIEPIVQGAAGIWPHSAEFLREARRLCQVHDVLFIADEVATGFGKSGKMFACEHADIVPDVLVIGKGLSAGYLPISAAVTTDALFEGFIGEPSEFKTFYYGQTFAGNPLAAAVAKENLQMFERSRLLDQLPERLEHFGAELEKYILPLRHVDEVRRFGVMTGIELTRVPGERQAYSVDERAGQRIVREARKLGVIIRPLGNVIVLMPPLVMTKADLTRLVEKTGEAITMALGS